MNDKRLGEKTATAFKSLCRFSLFLALDVFVYLFLKNDTTAQCSAKCVRRGLCHLMQFLGSVKENLQTCLF